MRELIIRFGKEGEYYRELDEDRNYFLWEADEILQKIKIRLDQEKRTVKQKTIELWMNGQKVLVTQMSFDKEQSLEKQLEEALCKTNKEQRQHVKNFKECAEKERQLFLNREFKTFAIRFDQVLGKPDMVPFPLVLEVDKLKKLFDEVYPHVATGFYSELEETITSIDSSYRTIVKQIRQNKTSANDAAFNKEVELWFEEDEYFSKFVQYAAASFQSVSKKRIDALYPRFRPYQELETFLFEVLACKKGFSDAYTLHAELNNAFLKEYDQILFQGTVLKKDEMVESLVLAPVIQKHWDKLPEIMDIDGKVILDAEQEQVTVSDIEEALADLHANDKGRYFLCICPECQQQEAFIYKNNPSFIQCNRENQCGERLILHFEEKDEVLSLKTISEKYPNLTKKQTQALDWMTRFMKHMQNHFDSPTLDNGYRGLSKETTKPFIVDLLNEAYVQKMFETGKELFPKNYSTNEWMCKRNLIFPIYGDDGHLDRILLRSSIVPCIEPKELQLIVNPSKETRDFFIDIPNKSNTLVISEAILDAASFREVDPAVGVLALTGAAKTRKMCQFILENKALLQDKNIILALDADQAGEKATKEMIDTLEQIQAEYQVFPFPAGIKDANEYLNLDRKKFTEAFNDVKHSFGAERRNPEPLNKRVVGMER